MIDKCKGVSVALDMPSQVEYNRKKNVQQDNQLKTLQENLNKLIENSPAGFLPQAYYGLVEGETQTYRLSSETIQLALPSQPSVGRVYSLLSLSETEQYIPAYVAFVSGTQQQALCSVLLKGDYNESPNSFDIVDMVSGEVLHSQQIAGATFTQQAASYVGEFAPQDNQNHQITALHDVSFNEENVVYASMDINADGVFNWVKIGNYRNGINGKSVKAVTATTMGSVLQTALVGDTLLAGETFSGDNYAFNIGDLKTITALSPLALQDNGNIRGATGATGAQGAAGQDGLTPHIENGYWYIGETNTNVLAQGQPGADGVDGNAFDIQTPLYSVPANQGLEGNTDYQGNALSNLPTLPTTGITGKAYVVFDPLTTPLTPYYDLYYTKDNDTEWTIIHPFTGLAGKNGVNGLTPYIQSNYWYIGNQNTGVDARGLRGAQGPQGEPGPQGPQGPQGPKGDPGTSTEFSHVTFNPSNGTLVYSDNKAVWSGNFTFEDTNDNSYTAEGQIGLNIQAGDNITIDADASDTNLVINSTASGGGGGATNEPIRIYKTSLSLNVKSTMSLPISTWTTKTWNGLTNSNGQYIWTDGENIYYSYNSNQFVLDKSTSTWSPKTWNGLTEFNGRYTWTDGDNIYYSSQNNQFVLDKSTSTWTTKTWNGLTSFYGNSVWTDGDNIYHSSQNNQFVLDKSTSTWNTKTWNGLTEFDGRYTWTDGDNIYYSFQNKQFVLDKSTSTWSPKTWNGLTEFAGSYIWTDGDNIYYSSQNNQFVLDKSTSTWNTKTWNGLRSFAPGNMWTDGDNIYYSSNLLQYILIKDISNI